MRDAIIRDARLSGGMGVALLAALLALGASGCTDAGRCRLGDPGCVALCTDTCGPEGNPGAWANDGFCDDGGAGSDWDVCAFGSDCGDCGARLRDECPPGAVACDQGGCWAPGVACWTVRECSDGQLYGCQEGYLLDCELAVAGSELYCVQSRVCDDTCPAADDGSCDDGGPDSDTSTCRLGTDCKDCGARDNPCDDASAFPVFCPATPADCWSRRVDCDAVQYCDSEAFVCQQGERVDCESVSGCAPTSCTDAALPVDCGTGTCFPKGTDCTTVQTCLGGSGEAACTFDYTVDCTVPLDPSCAPIP